MSLSTIIVYIGIAYLIYRLFKRFKEKRSRYIPEHVKQRVLDRYFGMCAVCPENNKKVMEYHHRKQYSNGGDHSDQNVVPLCPYHHSLVTRYPPTRN